MRERRAAKGWASMRSIGPGWMRSGAGRRGQDEGRRERGWMRAGAGRRRQAERGDGVAAPVRSIRSWVRSIRSDYLVAGKARVYLSLAFMLALCEPVKAG